MPREPNVIFEMDVPRCQNTYGVAPCTAALSSQFPAKCFNMPRVVRADGRLTGCQDPANYVPGTYTVRYALNMRGVPADKGVLPFLRQVPNGGAAEITIAPTDKYKGILGRRETLKVTLDEAPDNDVGLDPYQAERVSGAALFSGVGYNPEDQGTHFGRLFNRWPYWRHAPCRIRRFLVGDAWEDHTIEEFVIQSVIGPGSSKQYEIEIYDELAKVTEEKFIPPITEGSLVADIGTGLSSFDLSPEGIGDLQYDASGRIRINDEIMTYTRSGDTITPTERGVDGTTAASHSEGDGAQICIRYEDQSIDAVWYDILDRSGVSSARIDSVGFTEEIQTWMTVAKITRTLSEPEKAENVVKSLMTSFGFYAWWDRTAGLIKHRLNRPVELDETVPVLDGARSFIAGNFTREVLEEQRYTSVAYFHGLPDSSKNPNSGTSYKTASVARIAELSDEDAYGEERVLSLFNPWLGPTGSNTIALTVAFRLLVRFALAPVEIKRIMDRADADALNMGSPVDLTIYTEQDDDGSTPQRRYQLTRDQRLPGERNSVTLVSYGLADNFGYITEDDAPDAGAATEEERLTNAYICEDAPPYSFEPVSKIA